MVRQPKARVAFAYRYNRWTSKSKLIKERP